MLSGLDSSAAAVADATRRAVLQRLAQGPATAGQLAHLACISRPAVSRHLRVLREAGLVRTTSSGRHLWYEAHPEPLQELAHWLSDVAKRITDAPTLLKRKAP